MAGDMRTCSEKGCRIKVNAKYCKRHRMRRYFRQRTLQKNKRWKSELLKAYSGKPKIITDYSKALGIARGTVKAFICRNNMQYIIINTEHLNNNSINRNYCKACNSAIHRIDGVCMACVITGDKPYFEIARELEGKWGYV